MLVKVLDHIVSSKEYLLQWDFFVVVSQSDVSHWKVFLSLADTKAFHSPTELNFLVGLASSQVSRGFSCGLRPVALIGSVLVEARCKCRSHKESVMKTSDRQ